MISSGSITWNAVYMQMTLTRTQDGDVSDAVYRIEQCIEEVRQWMTRHNLLLNNTTEAVVITLPNRKHLQGISCRRIVAPSSTIQNIRITTDCGLTMSSNVARTCQSAYFQLYNI